MKISLSSDHILIKQFIDSTLFSFYKLENLINEINTYSFYSEYYEDLLKILRDFNEKITNRFKGLKSEIIEQIKSIEKNEPENETVEDIFSKYYTSLKRNNQFIAFFNEIVSTFMNAENFYIHQGNFILLDELLKAIK